jgi:hypothetical protein
MLPEGIVERWFIADGSIVAAGDPMAEIRIEDALHEIMAPASGRLTIVAAANTVFGIGGMADGGPARNPLLNLVYQGAQLSPGYIIGEQGVDIGLTAENTEGFAFIALEPDDANDDWFQPIGSFSLSGEIIPETVEGVLPFHVDTGVDEMILWLDDGALRSIFPMKSEFPAAVTVSISAPSADQWGVPALQYSFVTGDMSEPLAPAYVEWRIGRGINTGINVLAGADYLYDASAGRVGFRIPPANAISTDGGS